MIDWRLGIDREHVPQAFNDALGEVCLTPKLEEVVGKIHFTRPGEIFPILEAFPRTDHRTFTIHPDRGFVPTVKNKDKRRW